MNERLQKVLSWLQRELAAGARTMSITADDARDLLAATEPVGGELGEAVERLQQSFDCRQPHFSIRVRANDLAIALHALRQQPSEQPEAVMALEQRVIPDPESTSGHRIDVLVVGQPEADPELVAVWRRIILETAGVGYVRLQLAHAEKEAAAIRQVLKERGKTDGKAV